MSSKMSRKGSLIKEFHAKYWRKLVVDECPNEKAARLRRERVHNIILNVTALEAMRLWALENEKALVSRD
jgi:hypothetical protein